MIKKTIAYILSFSLLLPCFCIKTNAYSALSYCLYDPNQDRVLLSSNANLKLPMASTTKIMTGLLLCEIANLDTIITLTDKMVRVEGSSVGLKSGDKISYKCLLYGMMLESGNDAALSIAVSLMGSQENFAKLMNKKAKQLNMKNTNFVTPNGLDDKEHYSTAVDMAVLAGYAMKNEAFSKVVSSSRFRAEYNNGETIRTYCNHNRLLYMLDGTDGVKTGFTKKSGRCLVSSCVRNGVRLIAVTLKAGDDWNDHKNLYNIGFSMFHEIKIKSYFGNAKVVGSNIKNCTCFSNAKKIYFYDGEESFIKKKVIVPKFLYAPVKKGQTVGYIEYIYNNNVILKQNLISKMTINKQNIKTSTVEKILKACIMLLSIK